ncbi:MAG: 50S ribosomal protein L24 [Nitrospinae bacterium]|nr:50S ribosomal protein L24 [Nitrospinota bacterium]
MAWMVKKDDLVEVLTGKEKGKRGKVLRIVKGKDRVMVEKLMMVKRHTKPGQHSQQGGILEIEGTINSSNVGVICSSCDRPVRMKTKTLEGGRRVRACARCGEALE